MGVERERVEKADERREAAIASAAPLRPNFKPNSGITAAQLSKFQELHKRRLQIKAKSKVNKRAKGLMQRKGGNENPICKKIDKLVLKPVLISGCGWCEGFAWKRKTRCHAFSKQLHMGEPTATEYVGESL